MVGWVHPRNGTQAMASTSQDHLPVRDSADEVANDCQLQLTGAQALAVVRQIDQLLAELDQGVDGTSEDRSR